MGILRKANRGLYVQTNNLIQTYLEASQFMSDKGHTHGYIEPYGKLIQHLQHQKVTVCEVGVAAGGSLYLWDRYFTSPASIIYGADIQFHHGLQPWETIKSKLTKRVKLLETPSQLLADTELKNLTFDLVVDDASHMLDTQIDFIRFFLPRMKSKGVLIVEDILPDDWNRPDIPYEPDARKHQSVSTLLNEVPTAVIIDNRKKVRPIEMGGGTYSNGSMAIACVVP